MATYWKSQPRKFCDVCKCWLSDNKASIEFHERGKSHIQKKEKQIAILRKKSAKSFKHQQKAGEYLKQMEEAALKQYQKDLAERGIAIDESHIAFQADTSRKIRGYKFQDKDGDKSQQKSQIMKIIEAKTSKKSPWSKQVSPEGKTYYWNTETGKSQWEKPEGFIETPGEAQKKSHDEQSSKPLWTEQISPEGHTYYWNSETGKSSWEKPEGFVSEPIKETFKPVESKSDDKDDSQNGEAPAKKPRYNPYGSWSVVKQQKPKKEIDLQLPAKLPDPASEGLIDRAALENSFEPEKTKFDEKVVESLGDEIGSTVFKKKGAKQRSIRKRNADD